MRRALLLSLVVAASCASAAPPTRDPDTVGIITRMSDDRATILVEERPQETAGSAKTSVRVTSDTRVWRVGATTERADARDLRVGSTVRVWLDGPVATSYPGQAKGSDVAIDTRAHDAGLYVISMGGPEITVRVNGFEAARVGCNGGAAVRPGADGTPRLPWQVVVTRRSDGAVLLDDRVSELPRWLLVRRADAAISTAPIVGPFVPCP